MNIILNDFSIEEICDSGQCFRMNKLEDGSVEVIAKGKYLIVRQNGSSVEFSCDENEFEDVWKPYFDIDQKTDYGKIKASVDKEDLYLSNAIKFGDGIRILNQDLFEMIISFIISQRNNIKRIKACIKKLCEKYGEKRQCGDVIYYDFPTAEALYNADIEDIRSLGVGYRDAYIKRAAEAIYKGDFDMDRLWNMGYEEARNYLLTLHGVGAKVADCICLFALHKVDAFPRDTHIISIVDKEYNGEFPFEKYEGYAGVLQQYMFFYDLFGNN